VTGFAACLFEELRQSSIKVTTVFPGSTRTEFFQEIPGASAHANMVDPDELAATLAHVLDTSPNYLIREIEIRPVNSKPPKGA
jgi:short-subunit dehydrogenase